MLAAVLLCAGKGTRMNDNATNKVCFPCAGVPVVKRIIKNLRDGGIDLFVVVVGHQSQSVIDALQDEPNVLYAFQKEQKGTGHAALCGLEALKKAGFQGRAIITMGDKIVSPEVIRGLLNCNQSRKAVWGVQPLEHNYNGGRIAFDGQKAYGVVEFADAAYMSLAGVPREQQPQVLKELGLNEKKAEKILAKAKNAEISPEVTLAGKVFTAEEILATPYANAGFYCFDVDAVLQAISRCTTANAQGEIYLTDTLAMFAAQDQAVLYEIKNKEDMLTYSTKQELQEISYAFCRTASEFVAAMDAGDLDRDFAALYRDVPLQKQRYRELIAFFMKKYGDKKIIATRSPGRINLMGRHIDHRGGSVNVAAIDRDVVLVASPRKDDLVNISYLDGAYPDSCFSISQLLNMAPHENWLDYLEAAPVKEALQKSSGDAANYIKSAVLRFQLRNNVPFCGMDIVLTGSIPMAVGLSSSSAIVVAAAEAVCFFNSLVVTRQEFVELCGESEWFVGSRGGAADHAAMKCCKPGHITHLYFKPFEIGSAVAFSDKYAILLANSMQKAKKSEGCKDKFNAKVAASDVALLLLKQQYPAYSLQEFRDIAAVSPQEKIYDMILSLPREMTRQEILAKLPAYDSKLRRIFASHADPGTYQVRGVALYGISECLRAEKCADALRFGDYELLGQMMKISQRGDSVTDVMDIDDAAILQLQKCKTPLYLTAGAYECSTERIDGICNLLNSCDGVLGSSLIGAGLGGCVVALVEKGKAEAARERLIRDFYEKNGFESAVEIYLPSSGSAVLC